MMNAAAGIFLAAGRKKGWTNPYVTDGLIAILDDESGFRSKTVQLPAFGDSWTVEICNDL